MTPIYADMGSATMIQINKKMSCCSGPEFEIGQYPDVP
jgi:hypothetical protein